MLEHARDLFDLDPDVTYLNCAYLSPQLRSVTEAGLAAVGRKARPWETTSADFFTEAEELRALFARVLGADTDGVALIPSVSYGVGVAAANVPLGPDRGVLLLADDFPSDVYPWRAAAAASGATVTTVPRPDDGNWTREILARLDERIGAVAAPHCHWTDGTLVDLAAVGARAREVGAALVVDATQSLGVLPLPLAEARPAFVIDTGYKWLLGPYSVGYLWVDPAWRDGRPLEQGWIARAGAEDFRRLADYTDEWMPGARRFDVGERSNMVTVPMAIAALRQILHWGIDNIAARIAPLTARLDEAARTAGLVVAPHAPHLMGVRFPDGVPADLAGRLAAARVHVSLRGDSVRVGPYVYNSEADIVRLARVLTA